ncbi:hypothetical protein D3C72_1746090 [compost metagenome]
MPRLQQAGGHEGQHHHRLSAGNSVRRHQHAPGIQPVEKRSRHRRHQQEGNLQRKCREAEDHRRTGQRIGEPGGGDHLLPVADLRRALPGHEQPEAGIGQGAEAVR